MCNSCFPPLGCARAPRSAAHVCDMYGRVLAAPLDPGARMPRAVRGSRGAPPRRLNIVHFIRLSPPRIVSRASRRIPRSRDFLVLGFRDPDEFRDLGISLPNPGNMVPRRGELLFASPSRVGVAGSSEPQRPSFETARWTSAVPGVADEPGGPDGVPGIAFVAGLSLPPSGGTCDDLVGCRRTAGLVPT